MRTIIRSQMYQLKKTKFAFVIYILFVLIVILSTTSMLFADKCKTAERFALCNPDLMVSFGILTIGLWVGYTAGMDFKDKVSNYEVMYGHSRLQVFMGRYIVGCLVAAVAGTTLVLATFITGGVVKGFEGGPTLTHLWIRCALTFFPYLRMAAFLICLTFIIRNPYIIMALGYIMFMVYAVTSSLGALLSKSFFSSLTNLRALMDCGGWSIYNLDPSKGIVPYDTFETQVGMGLVFGTIGSSIFMAGIYLLIGYLYFAKSDLD